MYLLMGVAMRVVMVCVCVCDGVMMHVYTCPSENGCFMCSMSNPRSKSTSSMTMNI